MEDLFARYHELKQLEKQIETELDSVRKQILELYPGPYTVESGAYKCTISYQERRDYDDQLVYNALPDSSIWRLMSKADTTKINSLLKLDVINEALLNGTYSVKQIPYIRIQKV